MKTAESEDEEDSKGKRKPKKTASLNLKKLTVVGMCQLGVLDETMSQAFQSLDDGTSSPRTEVNFNYFEMKQTAAQA